MHHPSRSRWSGPRSFYKGARVIRLAIPMEVAAQDTRPSLHPTSLVLPPPINIWASFQTPSTNNKADDPVGGLPSSKNMAVLFFLIQLCPTLQCSS